jgi:hypothetical protein
MNNGPGEIRAWRDQGFSQTDAGKGEGRQQSRRPSAGGRGNINILDEGVHVVADIHPAP